MKIIFLDIDGVLNCSGCKDFIDDVYFVMQKKLELLKQLVEATEAKIVLSSTWRYGWMQHDMGLKNKEVRHFIALRDKLLEYDIELFSRTRCISEKTRGEEIDLWLKDWNGEPIESYVILDDLGGEEFRTHSQRLIQTSFYKGLTKKHVDKAIKLLNE